MEVKFTDPHPDNSFLKRAEKVNVNAHLHTPYSFSAFLDIDDALDRAVAEEVMVVGINDFYTTEGYLKWHEGCKKRHLFPLFGIEFISLNEEDQKAGLRVNDPANPGRTYLSGKGMSFPFRLDEPYATQLATVHSESNSQVETMCAKLNMLLQKERVGFTIDSEWIRKELTNGSLRERHLARALRIKICTFYNNDQTQVRSVLEKLFGGLVLKSPLDDIAGVENEIRANLLKTGGAAFVPEDHTAFLPMQTVCEIILAGGGIPTYPFLGDDANGNFTDFENDLERVAKQLTERGLHSVEFITARNDLQLLEKYASHLYEEGFVVTFGSEHNSPSMEPIELFARNRTPLTDRLKQINYEGACVIAAHQHLVEQGLEGYLNEIGVADRSKRDEFVQLGAQLIAHR